MNGKKLRFADFEVDFARRELRKRGVRVGLQHKPFRVLELLLQSPGELVTREQLSAFLWPDSHVSFERGLNTAVNSLRQVLGDSSRECLFIETRTGLGYSFSAPVQEVPEAKPKQVNNGAEGYQDYLKGRYFLDRMAEEEIHKAIAHFKSAAEDDSCTSFAHAGLADAYCYMALAGAARPADVSAKARSFAERAVANDPGLSLAHVSLARVRILFDWDWQSAQAAVGRALELDPYSAAAHTLHAALLRMAGGCEEALQICRRALALEPLSFPANLQLAGCLFAARQFKRAVDQCWKILTLESRFAPAQVLLALAYEQLGMYEEAVVEFQNAQNCSGFQAAAVSGLFHVCALAGLQSQADQTSFGLFRQERNRYVADYWRAVICLGQKQTGEALAFLEKSLAQRDPALLWLKADARFDVLQENPRFQELLRSLSFQGRFDLQSA